MITLKEKLKILVACEHSDKVSKEFRKLGHSVVTCDLKKGSSVRKYYQGDVKEILHLGFDRLIGFPECTYLCNSGVSWLHREPGRWKKMEAAVDFFYTLWDSGIPQICLENPVPHKYAKLPPYSQIINPWEHGHGETKRTCLWLKGLPKLEPRRIMKARIHRIHEMSPGPYRSERRAITYTGIARSMALSWG